jgi:uncharacterized protein (TIGR03083 family)
MIEERFVGDWPLPTSLLLGECDAYITDARLVRLQPLPTRCPPWTVLDITTHLAATFHRFAELLRRARSGESRPPFAPDALSEENLRAVREFTGDPHRTLCEEVRRFCELATDPQEPTINQHGMIPIGLQMSWGLSELAVHHDDIAHAGGSGYRPSDDAIQVIVTSYGPLSRGMPDADADRWEWILRASGR